MFWNQPTGKSSSQPNQGNELHLLVLALSAVGAAIGYKIVNAWNRFLHQHYFEVHLTFYGLFAALAIVLLVVLIRKTKKLREKVQLFEPYLHKDDGILVGQTTDGAVNLHLPDKVRTGHVQIIGSTGRGKTESVILPWLLRDVKRGKNPILIDGKGEPELADRIRLYLYKTGAKHRLQIFDLGNPEGSYVTNPLAYGSPQQITDRIMTSFDFEDTYYRGVQYSHLSTLIALIHGNAKEKIGSVTFEKIYELLTSIEALTKAVSENKDKSLDSKLMRLVHMDPKQKEKDLMGLISQLQPFAIGEVARLVNGSKATYGYQTISEIVLGESSEPSVFIILLPTLKYQSMGKQLGKCLLQELAWAVGERSSKGMTDIFQPIYLDEFSAFVYSDFYNVLNKARSAGVAFHLSHQSTGDLKIVDPNLATILNTNTNVKCLLGLNDPETADFFASHLGTETSEKTTERARSGKWTGKERTGELSLREVEEFKIHPNRLKNYTAGRGVLHFPTAKGNITEEVQFEAFSLNEY